MLRQVAQRMMAVQSSAKDRHLLQSQAFTLLEVVRLHITALTMAIHAAVQAVASSVTLILLP
jgi:hypothetical protein